MQGGGGRRQALVLSCLRRPSSSILNTTGAPATTLSFSYYSFFGVNRSWDVSARRFNSKLPEAHVFNEAAEETLHAIQERLEPLEDLNIPDFDIEYAVL